MTTSWSRPPHRPGDYLQLRDWKSRRKPRITQWRGFDLVVQSSQVIRDIQQLLVGLGLAVVNNLLFAKAYKLFINRLDCATEPSVGGDPPFVGEAIVECGNP